MRAAAIKRAGLGVLCAATLALGLGAPTAQAAFDDPLFVLTPQPPSPPSIYTPPLPPPFGRFEGPCGLAVGANGGLYVSDYYHHTIDLFGANVGPTYPYGYLTQLAGVDPLDGPCALALDSSGRLYVNDFHRNVVRFDPAPTFGTGTVIDESHPTGLAVDPLTDTLYVNERTRIAVFDSLGAEVGEIGATSLQDAYGLAVSGFPATEGFLYVPDAATNTVKVYDPATDMVNPIATIDGSGTPLGHFVSLRNAAVAVDDTSGEIYVADNLQPAYTERPETVVYVFAASGTYEGRLKISVENSLPPGLAVDNSATVTQGRVYVTSGNSESASVYAYPPGAATAAAVPLAQPALAPAGGGAGSGALSAPPTDSAAAPLAAPAAGLSVSATPAAAMPAPTGAPTKLKPHAQSSQRKVRRHHHAQPKRQVHRHVKGPRR